MIRCVGLIWMYDERVVGVAWFRKMLTTRPYMQQIKIIKIISH